MTKPHLKIVDYTPGHLSLIQLRDVHRNENVTEINTRAFTVLRNDRPIAIFGGSFFIPGVLQVWGLYSDEVREVPMALLQTARVLLEHVTESYELRRIQMTVPLSTPWGFKWAQKLGFRCEGILKQYGPNGSDYWMFGRTQ